MPNHAAIYCGDSELLHHIPEQLSKRERYTDKWQRRTPSGVTGHGTHLPLRGFATIWPPHRPSCENGAEAIRALATQLPAFRQKLNDGWYQVRIAGRDAGETELSARLNEPLANGAVIHIVPRLAGAKSGGVFQVVLGAALIAVAWWNPVGWLGAAAVSGMYAAGASMIRAEWRRCWHRKPVPQQRPARITVSRTRISRHWITWLPGQCSACSVR